MSHFYVIRPDDQFITQLCQWVEDDSKGSEDALGRGVKHLKKALWGSDPSQLTERLLREYTRLFRGIKEGYGLPPPYESVYRESRLMGDVTAVVVDKYAQAGYAVIDPTTSPQDHIGAELKFMSLLCYDEGIAWQKGDTSTAVQSWRRQAAFLDEHLLQWVPAYCCRVQEETMEPFYRAAAMITEQTLVQDRRLLSNLHPSFAVAEPEGDGKRREQGSNSANTCWLFRTFGDAHFPF